MRTKEEIVRAFADADASSLSESPMLENLRYKRERLFIEVLLDIRDLLEDKVSKKQ